MKYEVCVIGGGPAGIKAAQKAVEAGFKTALIEKDQLGGTCLNYGCVPTKMLYEAAHRHRYIRQAEQLGLQIPNVTFNWNLWQTRTHELIKKLQSSVKIQLKAAQVDCFYHNAEFVSENQLQLADDTKIESAYFIVATGATSRHISNSIDISDFWNLPELPPQIAIAGGGVSGCELASILAELEFDVTLHEKNLHLLAGWDEEVVDFAENFLKKQGVKVITAVSHAATGFCLNAAGRTPVKPDVPNNPNIIVIGDASGGVQSAIRAEVEAIDAINWLKNGIPMAVRTYPQAVFMLSELAMFGLTEDACRNTGQQVKTVKKYFAGNVRAQISGEVSGFVKNIYSKAGELLGQHITGFHASELIQVAAEIPLHPTFFEMLRK